MTGKRSGKILVNTIYPVSSYKPYMNLRAGLNTFSDRSSVHGIYEAYSAKNWGWRIIWLTLLTTSLSITLYQIYNTISDFIANPTKIQIQILEHNEPYYPPLIICYPHWLLWVDEKKAMKLGLDKNTILYSISYLSPIYSKTEFDINSSRVEFFKFLANNNVKHFQDYYLAIAKDTPPFFRLFTTAQFTFQKVMISKRFNDLAMCYTLTVENITNLLSQQQYLNSEAGSRAAPRTLNLGFTDRVYPYPNQILDKDERNAYIIATLRNIYGAQSGLNETALANMDLIWPPRFSADGNEVHTATQTFTTGVYRYVIKLGGKVFRWMNSTHKPCVNMKAHVQYYEECMVSCMHEIYSSMKPKKDCLTYFEAVHRKNISFKNVCSMDIYFNLSQLQIFPESENMNRYLFANSGNCTKRKCLTSCEEWIYESVTSSSSFDMNMKMIGIPTIITIEYPQAGAVVVFAEVVSQTWDLLVGNVGGILGLWLGASILSLWQTFYLICCSRE